ncbi:hypothetical protein QDR74_00205 [Acinetobacter baumannii]|uniref:hypothetical protein n=1 Tax=Acinetobacter baumannii TaxID=470 RepID=UPI00244A228E|nr:hypothetical protein [Acinetobacter baumannii]MDH2497046.1 hypothetical protein [Acinetobacter baumannii]
MLKKSLHDQIKIIGFWTVGGVFWYLVIAFFLKSKYPIFDYSFNLEIAYDVIKDALTLAASFLAPVAAFVLFTDWRIQHNKAFKASFFLNLYKDYFEYRFQINKVMQDLKNILKSGYNEDDLEDIKTNFDLASSRIIQVMSDICEVVEREDYEKEFMPLISDLNNKFIEIKNLIKLLYLIDSAEDKEFQLASLSNQFEGLDADLYGHMKSFLFHSRKHYIA